MLIRAGVILAGWLVVSLSMATGVRAQWNVLNSVADVKQQEDGVLLKMQKGTLRLQFCSNSIVRVTYAAGESFPDVPSYVITKASWPKTKWTIQSGEKDVVVTTARVKLSVGRKDSAILFSDATGKKLFQDYDRSLTPVEVNGEKTYHSELFSNLWDSTEAFYGLGQHQAGVWNYHGETVDISISTVSP